MPPNRKRGARPKVTPFNSLSSTKQTALKVGSAIQGGVLKAASSVYKSTAGAAVSAGGKVAKKLSSGSSKPPEGMTYLRGRLVPRKGAKKKSVKLDMNKTFPAGSVPQKRAAKFN